MATAGTGPYARHGDTGTETHPHLLEPVRAPGLTGRTLLVVGLLVVLVGGGSALGTMAVLSRQEQGELESVVGVVEPPAAKVERAEAAPLEGSEDASKGEEQPREPEGAEPEAAAKVVVPEPAEPEAAVKPGEPEGEPAEPDVIPSEVVSPSTDDGSKDAAVEDEEVASPGREGEEPTADDRRAPAAARVPKHETETCAKARAAAKTALDQRRWAEAAKLSKQRECWSSAAQGERRRIQVNALLESGRFAECVTAGSKATDQATVKLVEICRKRSGQ